jgi:hypothetical protein
MSFLSNLIAKRIARYRGSAARPWKLLRAEMLPGNGSKARRRDEISDFYFFTPRSAVPIAQVGKINKRLDVIRPGVEESVGLAIR